MKLFAGMTALRLLRLVAPDLRRMNAADRAGLVGWAVLLVVVAAATALSVRRVDRTPGSAARSVPDRDPS